MGVTAKNKIHTIICINLEQLRPVGEKQFKRIRTQIHFAQLIIHNRYSIAKQVISLETGIFNTNQSNCLTGTFKQYALILEDSNTQFC